MLKYEAFIIVYDEKFPRFNLISSGFPLIHFAFPLMETRSKFLSFRWHQETILDIVNSL